MHTHTRVVTGLCFFPQNVKMTAAAICVSSWHLAKQTEEVLHHVGEGIAERRRRWNNQLVPIKYGNNFTVDCLRVLFAKDRRAKHL